MNNLACTLYYRETLKMRREILGDQHPDTLTSMNNLASLLQAKGELAEAESLHRETLKISRENQLSISKCIRCST